MNHDYEKFRAGRRDAGRLVDPETAELHWIWANVYDPYGIAPDLPDEFQQLGREYFVSTPNTNGWVHFSDLPEATRKVLWARARRDREAEIEIYRIQLEQGALADELPWE